jgi:hypothetical protein
MRFLLAFFCFSIAYFEAFSEANYVYHEASTNQISAAALRFRNVLVPNKTQSITIGFKIEWENYWNQARIYYTTDGSNPSGAFGVGAGTTQVLTAIWDHKFGSPLVDAVFATIPAQSAGTTVKYIVSAWHSGGGDEIFGNGCGNAPNAFCSSDNNSSSLATIFSYTVRPVMYYINDGSQTNDVYTTAVGNDVNDGLSPSTPKLTLTSLLSTYQLTGLDTVYIDAGSYTNTPQITPADQGNSLSAYLVFKGADTSKTIFSTSTTKYNFWINRSRFLWIEGISFVNTYTGGSTDSTFNIIKNYGKSTVIKKCKFDIQGSSTRPSRNIFFQCNLNTDLDMARTLISGNRILNSRPNGVGIFALGDVDSSRIELNQIVMTGTTGRGMAFRYVNAYDESNPGAGVNGGFYWPIVDTIFKNTITCATTGIDFNYNVVYALAPAGIRYRAKLFQYLVESNTINVTASSATISASATPEIYSSIWMRLCGAFDKSFTIKKNRLIGGYSGIYMSGGIQNMVAQNNYICSQFGMYHEKFEDTDPDATTPEDNDGNQFVHNSVYTTASCLVFGYTATGGHASWDWDVRNNILYTQNTSGGSACYNFLNVTTALTSENMRYCNSNLLYNGGASPNNLNVSRIVTNLYRMGNWSSTGISDSMYVANDGPFDTNSFFYMPNWQDRASCDLDLLPDAFWPTSYPNFSYPSASGTKFTYTGLTNTDIKNIPSRTYVTIGAFEAGSSTQLPVRLLSFEASYQSGKVNLSWLTADEINNDYFVIEKSTDGISWSYLNMVDAVIPSSARFHSYGSTDKTPGTGLIYYRLRQVDTDGRYTYSQIRSVRINHPVTFSIFPNPGKGQFTISGLEPGLVHQIRVLDVAGKLIHSANINSNIYQFYMDDAAPGVYFIQVDGKQHLRFVKLQ